VVDVDDALVKIKAVCEHLLVAVEETKFIFTIFKKDTLVKILLHVYYSVCTINWKKSCNQV